MSSPSGFDTAVRGAVMLAVVGGAGWGAMQYPPLRERVFTLWRDWERGQLAKTRHDGMEQARSAGGDAPPFSPADGGGYGTRSVPTTLDAPLPLATDEQPQPLQTPRRPLPDNLRETDAAPPRSLYAEQQVEFRRDAAPAVSNPAGDSQAELDELLRLLGATYCLLERWEETPPRYRFHCRVTLAPGAEPRRFEAVGSDPLRLMREVADAVSASRPKRAP